MNQVTFIFKHVKSDLTNFIFHLFFSDDHYSNVWPNQEKHVEHQTGTDYKISVFIKQKIVKFNFVLRFLF